MMFTFDTTISSAVSTATPQPQMPAPATGPLSPELLTLIHQYWQAANYLTIGQIYLQENPLLTEPLRPEHIKPRLLGHWGTSPGLNLLYVHLNRLIRQHDVDAIFLAGPGHGGPAVLANVYLEGTYSEVYTEVPPNAKGMRRLFRRFSTPGGVPSHVSVPTPGSIHERSEEHTSELQSHVNLVCRLLLEKKKKKCREEALSATRLWGTAAGSTSSLRRWRSPASPSPYVNASATA